MATKKVLPDLDPLTREGVAEWIDWQGQRQAKALAQSEAYLKEHPDHPGMAEQIAYYHHAVGFANFLSYQVRNGRTKKLVAPAVQAR